MENPFNPDTAAGRATAPGLNRLFTIKAQGLTVTAKEVHTIHNWGGRHENDPDDWHTEFTCTGGKYRSYKQSQDGGTITFHD